MRITTLVENSRESKEFESEWGLSLFIEVYERRIIFDFGSSPAFLRNAKKLDLDLSTVDLAVLSHGHSDHGGGLPAFFSVNNSAPLYLRTTADGPLYHKLLIRPRYAGLDRGVLTANQKRLRWVDEDSEIAPGVHLIVSLANTEPKPDTQRDILVKTEQGFAPDEFSHELFLVVKENDGMSVVTGCGHRGILNMVLAAKEKLPAEPIKAVVGGFHMIGRSLFTRAPMTGDEVARVARRLKELGCRRVISGHCTRNKARGILREELGEAFSELKTGTRFEL